MRNETNHLQSEKSQTQWLLSLLFIFVCASASLAIAWVATEKESAKQFHSEADLMLRDIGELVVETRGIMKSMLGMHYASDEFAGSDIEAFSEQLRTYSPYVQAIGMFGVVDEQYRKEYESYASITYGQEISIRSWGSGENSDQAADDLQQTLFPVNLIDPLDATGLSFLGTDVTSVSSIKNVLNTLTNSGDAVLLPMPTEWPISGEAILLQPVYAGAQPPMSEEDRRESIVGGIWVAIDLSQMLASSTEKFPHIKLELSIGTKGQRPKQVLGIDPTTTKYGIDFRYGSAQAESQWWIGPSLISVVASAPLLAGTSQLTMLVLIVCVTILLAGAALIILYFRQEQVLERRRAEVAISAERDKARYTLQSVRHPVLSLDSELRCVYLNPAAETIVSGELSKAVGQPVSSFLQLQIDQSNDSVSVEKMCESLADGETRELDVLLDTASSELSTWSMALTRIAASDAKQHGYILVLRDVSKERLLTSELEHRAHHDTLTGIYNRYYFEHRLRELVNDLDHSNRHHALCFIDLDKFKVVNDTCGHPAGDRLLIELTDALSTLCRRSDVFARLGGDEFGLLIVDANLDDARAVAQKFHDHFQMAVFNHDGAVFPVRASMGLVEIGGVNCEINQIMKGADLACYAAKDGGRNALVVYSPDDADMNERQEQINWRPILEKAISEDGFELFLQPIMSVSSKDDVMRFECLLRLKDEAGGYIAPYPFIKAAERYDLMPDIDRWVINRAMEMMQQIEEQHKVSISLSINLSGLSVADLTLPAYIASVIKQKNIDPTRLWFEITETAAISNFANGVEFINAIRAQGSRVALDDFGSGLSSFAYLRDLPIDLLKFDGQFVKEIANCPVSNEMVRAMHQVARKMSIETVAEFVEDEAIWQELQVIGIDYAQGWYVGRPASLDEMIDINYFLRKSAA